MLKFSAMFVGYYNVYNLAHHFCIISNCFLPTVLQYSKRRNLQVIPDYGEHLLQQQFTFPEVRRV